MRLSRAAFLPSPGDPFVTLQDRSNITNEEADSWVDLYKGLMKR